MQNSNSFVSAVNALLQKLDAESSINTAIDLANEILGLLGSRNKKSAEEVFESSIELPNAERYDSWFQPHPIFKSDRACFELSDDSLLQAKFYWLKRHSRQIVAGGVHFTPNFEDEDFTHNDHYKVGIDFFLSPNAKSLSVVLSNRGNLRIVELNKRLNSTQVDIFSKWVGAENLSTRDTLHSTLWESFRLKSVNQKFYDGVANSFNELFQHLKSINREDEEAKLFASRLLGRLLFCWFLRKKGIINESIGYFNAQGHNSTDYYRSSLEKLFFLTLNTPVDDRGVLNHSDIKTPYLNGGLFEPHENDWFKDNDLTFPEGFFANLFEHFDQFNFTTDESSPEYELIAIDPEMLGRVFESLLATQLDETGQQARKAKGAFYTPREIVSYMCKESLRNYLYNTTEGGDDTKASIDSLLDISDSEWAKAKSNTLRDKIKDYRTQIMNALDTVTILDPACGSGAFPIGMLQLIVKTYERLESRFDPYKTKLQIIQNNIFGVDIEPMAVEIARLRAWLSLIVDGEDSRNVEPLPNLDFKFVCADSLIPLDESKADLFNDPELHNQLAEIRQTYFNARKPHTKKAAQDKYYKLTKAPQGFFDNERTKQLKSFDPFKNSHPSSFFNSDQMFGLEDGFDVVIGNPPYIQLQKIKPQADILGRLSYKTFARTGDIYCLFYERGFELLKEGGTLSFITSNKWMKTAYGEKLRKFFIENTNPQWLIDFGSNQVFESATVDTNILIAEKSPFQNQVKTAVQPKKSGLNNMSIYFRQNYIENSELSHDKPWVILGGIEQDIKLKIEKNGLPLKSWDISINYGVKTGFNEAFIIDTATKDKLIADSPKAAEIIRPILLGKDIKRYSFEWNGWWLINSHNGIRNKGIPRVDVEKDYPVIFEYLKQFQAKLEKRLDKGEHWTNLRNCAYLEDFDRQKIAWGNLALRSQFCIIPKNYFINAPSPFFTSDNYYILAVLNSTLGNYYIKQLGVSRSGGYTEYKPMYVEKLPIPTVDDKTISMFRNMVLKIIEMKEQNIDTEDQEALINKKVFEIYGITDQEAKFMLDRDLA